MARKATSAPKEEVSPPPEEVAKTILGDIPETVVEPIPEEIQDESRIPFKTVVEAENYMEACLVGTMDEVNRCDEYIQSKMDSSRRFQTYKEEIFMYRYKVHQLRFHPKYPNIRPCDFPERPEKISDQ